MALERGFERGARLKEELEEQRVSLRERRVREKLRVKSESAELNTQIYFDTLVGQPIAQAEEILRERDRLLHADPGAPQNPLRQIERYFKNIRLGRHHYVGYAASVGYASINYQDPQTGDTALHIAARMGHVQVRARESKREQGKVP